MAILLDGARLARHIRHELKKEIATLPVTPCITAILIGDDSASRVYVRIKERRCRELGIRFELIALEAQTSDEEIIAHIRVLNSRRDVHAILIQLPLPAQHNTDAIIYAMDPSKDVDGFHPENIARFIAGEVACTEPVLIRAITSLITAAGVDIQGKRAAILGRSDVFMRPLGAALQRMGLTLTSETLNAAVVVSALGAAHTIHADLIATGAILIDVGITKQANKILGDFHPECASVAAYMTPVPGGVGPMTVAMLLSNVVHLAQNQIRV